MFFPIIVLMLIVALLRYYITKIMYATDTPLLQKASLSYKVLKHTLFERYADIHKEPVDKEFDITKALEEVKDEVKDK